MCVLQRAAACGARAPMRAAAMRGRPARAHHACSGRQSVGRARARAPSCARACERCRCAGGCAAARACMIDGARGGSATIAAAAGCWPIVAHARAGGRRRRRAHACGTERGARHARRSMTAPRAVIRREIDFVQGCPCRSPRSCLGAARPSGPSGPAKQAQRQLEPKRVAANAVMMPMPVTGDWREAGRTDERPRTPSECSARRKRSSIVDNATACAIVQNHACGRSNVALAMC